MAASQNGLREEGASVDDAFARAVQERVRSLVTADVTQAGGSPDIELVAQELQTSVRTLQRRLQAAGLTYAGAVQNARCAVAREMLRDQAHRIGEVARLLGYSHPAHFTRAFQRWTGLTPSQFRRRG